MSEGNTVDDAQQSTETPPGTVYPGLWTPTAESAQNLKRTELLEKVRRLSEFIEVTEGAKRAAARDYNDELKELRKELQDTLAVLKETSKDAKE